METERWTAADIGDLRGRRAVVTGANTGLGLETAAALAGGGAHVVLAVRDMDKGRAAVETLRARHAATDAELVQLDLADLDSVGAAAASVLDSSDGIDLLINNAGVMYTPPSSTVDGFEMQFGTNHLGPFAFTGLLLGRMIATPGSRVVTVSSVGHRIRSRIDLGTVSSLDGYDRIAAYGRSKLANLLFTYELQRRLAATATLALAAHPGASNTELTRNAPGPIRFLARLTRPLAQSAAMGALPTLRAATDPAAPGGGYYGPGGIGEVRGYPELVSSSERSHDVELQGRLWERSVELTGVEPAV